MSILFQETETFQQDLQRLDNVVRNKVVSTVNEVALVFAPSVSGFAALVQPLVLEKMAIQSVAMDLGGGYESSLHTVGVVPDLFLVLSVDGDPFLSQIILTLYRAVSHSQLQEACDEVFQAIRKSLFGSIEARAVAIG